MKTDPSELTFYGSTAPPSPHFKATKKQVWASCADCGARVALRSGISKQTLVDFRHAADEIGLELLQVVAKILLKLCQTVGAIVLH